MTVWLSLVRRDLRLALSSGAEAWVAVMFFIVVVSLFPLGVGPGPQLLARMAAGVIWVAALLAALLSIDRLFREDFEDGSLDRLAMLPLSLEALALAKAVAHWLVTGLPLLLVAPLMAVLMGLPSEGFTMLYATLLLGTPALSLTGSIGAALTLGARRGGALIALLTLPLFVPLLVFAVSAIEMSISGLDPTPSLALLGALSILSLTLSPFAAALALRQALG